MDILKSILASKDITTCGLDLTSEGQLIFLYKAQQASCLLYQIDARSELSNQVNS